MDLNLKGKTAMVCGSTQGIGKAAAIELARLGCDIVLVARDDSKLKEVIVELKAISSGNHAFIVADFNQPDDLQQKVQAFCAKQTVHILVNNTGGPPPGPAIEAAPEQFMKAFTSHLICNQLLVKAVVDGMKREKFGRIISVISTSVKMPIRGLGVSNTIRGAVANWSKTLSVELAPFGITVNNVLPGATLTGRLEAIMKTNAEKKRITVDEEKQSMVKEIPVGRIADPSEVAAAIAFLATNAASYINGINLPVDGGRTGTL